MANITPQLDKILSAVYGEEVRGSIHDALVAMNGESSSAMEYASTAQDSAANSATAAATSASNAAQSATSASTSAESASESATAAQGTVTEVGQIKSNIETLVTNATASINASVTQAANSATAASSSASGAGESANRASSAATSSESYAKGGTGARTGEDSDNAKFYSQQASTSATAAATSESNAAQSATSASTSAGSAGTSATLAESYTKGGTGTRTGEDSDNAKYYKDLAKSYAESASQGIEPATTTRLGGVKPDGTTITVDNDGTIHGTAEVDVATTTTAGIVKPDGTTITVDQDGTIHGVGGSNVSVDGTTIVKDSNDVISVNEYVGTKAQADANLSSIPEGATVYTTDESGELSIIDTELNASSNHAIANSTVTNALTSKANKSDITNIIITGTTNNTGSNILAGTLFYLNGVLCKALVDIANGATFTEGTNYSVWSIKDTQDKVTIELIPNVLYIDKVGKLCILHTRRAITVPTGSHQRYETVIEANIPTGFRPISTTKDFAVSSNKNTYAIELPNSNKLSILVWAEQITTDYSENIQFSIPYFTYD